MVELTQAVQSLLQSVDSMAFLENVLLYCDA